MTMFRPLYCFAAGLSALSFLAVNASAAELVIRDAQIIGLVEPGRYDYNLTSGSTASNGKDGFDTAGAFEIGGRYSLARPGDAFGFVSGIDISLRQAESSSSDLQSYLLHGSVGIGWAISDRWLITLEGGAGFGYSDFTTNGTANYPAFSDKGDFFMIDSRITAGFLVNDHWRILGVLGYGQTTYEFQRDRIDLEMTQMGFSVGIGFSYVFTRVPTLVK